MLRPYACKCEAPWADRRLPPTASGGPLVCVLSLSICGKLGRTPSPQHHEGSSSTMEYTDILVERQDGVVTITLNRPERLNAMTWHSVDEILDVLRRASEDDDSKAVIITGTGRGFCSGRDLAAAAEQRDAPPPPEPSRAQQPHRGH